VTSQRGLQQAAGVGRRDHLLQISHCAPVRIDLEKIATGITMKLPFGVQHHRRNPDRGCA
jgi:hypothetical protein